MKAERSKKRNVLVSRRIDCCELTCGECRYFGMWLDSVSCELFETRGGWARKLEWTSRYHRDARRCKQCLEGERLAKVEA